MRFETYLGIFGCVGILTVVVSLITTYLSFKNEYTRTIKQDISLRRMQELEENLSNFLRENQLSRSASVSEIANVLKIVDAGEDSNISCQAKLSDPDKFGSRSVTFKTGLTPEKRNFAYAHECVHLINGDEAPYARPEGRDKALVEQLADYTAAAILLPKDEVYAYLESKRYRSLLPREKVNVIRKLCTKYSVSEVIVLRRVKEIYELKQ